GARASIAPSRRNPRSDQGDGSGPGPDATGSRAARRASSSYRPGSRGSSATHGRQRQLRPYTSTTPSQTGSDPAGPSVSDAASHWRISHGSGYRCRTVPVAQRRPSSGLAVGSVSILVAFT